MEIKGINTQISGVEMNGTQAALLIDGPQTVVLGPDPVLIDGFSGSLSGLHLLSGTVSDTGQSQLPVLEISGPYEDMTIEGGQVTLTRQISLGQPLDGNSNCPIQKPDHFGMHLVGSGTPQIQLLGGAILQCFFQDAISSQAAGTVFVGSDGRMSTGAPTTIVHAGCSGVYAQEGAVYLSNATLSSNHYGVVQRSAGVIALGTDARLPDGTACTFCSGNVISCVSPQEPGRCLDPTWPAIQIWDNSENALHAEGMTLDGTGRDDYTCANGGFFIGDMTGCTCSGSACMSLGSGEAPPDGAQTVTSSDTSAPASSSLIVTSGATLRADCE